MAEEKKIEIGTWKNVNANVTWTVSDIISFLNVINQRLCVVEDNVTLHSPIDGKLMSASDFQHQLAEEQIKQAQAKQAEAQKAKEEQDKKVEEGPKAAD